jgi:hypothetical protein
MVKQMSQSAGLKPRNDGDGPKSGRPYPNKTLEEALKIPIAIREKNNGNPWATEDVAQAAYGLELAISYPHLAPRPIHAARNHRHR